MSQRIIKQIFQIDSKVISDEFQNLLTKEYLYRNYETEKADTLYRELKAKYNIVSININVEPIQIKNEYIAMANNFFDKNLIGQGGREEDLQTRYSNSNILLHYLPKEERQKIEITLQKTVFQALRFQLNGTKEFQCNSNGSLHIDNIRLSISENMLSVKCIEKSSDINNLRFTITLTLEEK